MMIDPPIWKSLGLSTLALLGAVGMSTAATLSGQITDEKSAPAGDVQVLVPAVQKGAKVLTGGKAPGGPGFFYPATVLSDVPNDAKMLNDEIFGPVASLQTFKNEDEVITRANDTEYGLVAYLYTKDLSRGLRVSEKLDFGMIGLNRGIVSDPAAPFGGMKQSGLGREGGHEGLMEFLETQYVSVNW